MKYPVQDGFPNDSGSGLGSAESTLRLIAALPAPAGLEERVNAGLHVRQRTGRVLAWPAVLRFDSAWVRTAAAAAIVSVVVGGGWGIYAHVQPSQSAKGVAAPPHVASPVGGFSSAGAMRTPNTLNGQVVALPATAQKQPVKAGGNITARTAQTPPRHNKLAAADKAVAPAAK
jgi:hypothetical protein